MMKEQAGFDIKVIVSELGELAGSRVKKFYNTEDGELLIKLYSPKIGQATLRALKGTCIHLTKFDRESSEQPSNFTMLMRKYMNDAVLTDVEQPLFERVVKLVFRKGTGVYNVIIELFNKGNILVCNEKMIIINSLRFVKSEDRLLRPNEEYALPKPRFQEVYLDSVEFKRVVKSSRQESLVKCAAIELGLGGKYAEELCSLSGIDKTKNPAFLSSDELAKLFNTFFVIYKSVKHYKNIKPCVIISDGKLADFAPFPLKSYEGSEFKTFPTFNEACDYYYSNIQKQDYEEQAQKTFESKINTLSRRLDMQEESLSGIQAKIDKYNKIGETIYGNYDLVDSVLSKLQNANKNNIPWSQIKSMVEHDKEAGSAEANIIKSINENDNTVIFEIGGFEFSSSLNSDAKQTAGEYFEKAKRMKAKIEGAESSISETRTQIDSINETGVAEQERIMEKKEDKREWYEKYLWLKTSNNFLLVCGKDAIQNEVLVKKVAEDDDLIFHTSIQGSPFGILKKGVSAAMADKQEAAVFITTYSRAWRERVPTDVFFVNKSQVSKTAPTGEYVPHGAFIITGSKEEFKNVWPNLALGYDNEDRIIGGPVTLISSKCEAYVELEPGNLEPGKVAKRIQSILGERNNKLLELRSEEFLKWIPGNSMVVA